MVQLWEEKMASKTALHTLEKAMKRKSCSCDSVMNREQINIVTLKVIRKVFQISAYHIIFFNIDFITSNGDKLG